MLLRVSVNVWFRNFCLVSLALLAWVGTQANGQTVSSVTDSLTMPQDTLSPLTPSWTLADKPIQPSTPSHPAQKIERGRKGFSSYPSSGRAVLAALIPGGGQIYNKQYWKLPVVWGALATCSYVIGFNQRIYNEYHTAYVHFMSENPMQYDSWKAFVPSGADPAQYVGSGNIEAQLKRGTSDYKQNRDVSIVAGVALYLLSIIDAFVDAELYHFDVNSDLSVGISPSVELSGPVSPPSVGMSWSLHF